MKIIELLNIINDGKKVPRLIEINDIRYEFSLRSNDIDDLYLSVVDGRSWNHISNPIKLNDEVKIIEKNNKIEKLNGWYSIDSPKDYDYATANFENFYNKINEIIDYINKE